MRSQMLSCPLHLLTLSYSGQQGIEGLKMLWRYVRTDYVQYEQIVYVRTDCVCTGRLHFNQTHREFKTECHKNCNQSLVVRSELQQCVSSLQVYLLQSQVCPGHFLLQPVDNSININFQFSDLEPCLPKDFFQQTRFQIRKSI